MIYSIRIENQREKGTQVIHSNVNTSVGNNILKTHLSLPFNNKTQKSATSKTQKLLLFTLLIKLTQI